MKESAKNAEETGKEIKTPPRETRCSLDDDALLPALAQLVGQNPRKGVDGPARAKGEAKLDRSIREGLRASDGAGKRKGCDGAANMFGDWPYGHGVPPDLRKKLP